ncbi:BLUF domain-containing protein [Curtobacterium luteum]|uniref:BLUF domain-containing protein n=1 Tax=Curtobacterium luteum TaxID=33881 RepID=UPI0038019AF0
MYSSIAVIGFDLPALDELLQRSRVANAEADVTGLLLFREHRFLQLLEGPESAVREKMSLIAEDPRHERVRVLLEEHVLVRQFPEWTMGYAADGALRAASVPGYRTAFDDIDSLPDNQVGGPVASALRELIRWFRTE